MSRGLALKNLTRSCVLSVWLYRDGQAIWHQGSDAGVAVIALDREALPDSAELRAFTPGGAAVKVCALPYRPARRRGVR